MVDSRIFKKKKESEMNLFIFINKMFSCAYVLVFFICLADLKSQYTYHSGVLLQAPNKKKLIILF